MKKQNGGSTVNDSCILVVEDEVEIAELIEFHAKRDGFRTRVVHSGKTALESLARDTSRPEGSGLGLRLARDSTDAHHGSLSREIREVVESRLKAGDLKAIVATNSSRLC